MIGQKTKRAFLAVGAFALVGFVLWPGCATPPLPASRKSVSSLKPADFAFVKKAHPARSEIVRQLGEPDSYFADLKVACYQLNRVSRRRLWLLFGVLPIAAPRDPDRIEGAVIEFDDNDRAVRFEVIIFENGIGSVDGIHRGDMWYYSAQQWLTKPSPHR